MKILIDIGHPSHVHFFKNFIWNMEIKGHKIKITARDKDVTIRLLEAYRFKYENLGSYESIIAKLWSIFLLDYKLFKISKKFKPDIFVSWGSINAAHVSKLLGRLHISFDDNECAWEQRLLYAPFTDIICTSTSFKKSFGNKHIRYNSYEELAYLHESYFKPDFQVLVDYKLNKSDKLIILRLVSWNASHDINESGFKFQSKQEITRFIDALEKYGKVLLISEMKLPPSIESYKAVVSPEKIHDILYFADLYIGEGATMAAEAAILGTPSIYVSSIKLGFIDELKDKYDLVKTCEGQENALQLALQLLKDENLKNEWKFKSARMLEEKIDLTKFMITIVEKNNELLKNKKQL